MEANYMYLNQNDSMLEKSYKIPSECTSLTDKVTALTLEIAKKQSDFLTLKQKIILTDSLINSYNACKSKTKVQEEEILSYKNRYASSTLKYEELLQKYVSLNNNIQRDESKLKLLEDQLESAHTKEQATESYVNQLKEHVKNLEAKAIESSLYTDDLKSKYRKKISQKKTKNSGIAPRNLYRHVIMFGEKAKTAGLLSVSEIVLLNKLKKEAFETKQHLDTDDELVESVSSFTENENELHTGPPSCISTDSGLSSFSLDDLKDDVMEDSCHCSHRPVIDKHLKVYVNQSTSPIRIKVQSCATSPIRKRGNSEAKVKDLFGVKISVKNQKCKSTMTKEKSFVNASTYVNEKLINEAFVTDEVSDDRITKILNKMKSFVQPLSPISPAKTVSSIANNNILKKDPLLSQKLFIKKRKISKIRLKRLISQRNVKKQKYFKYVASMRNEMRIHKQYLMKKLVILENKIEKIQDTNTNKQCDINHCGDVIVFDISKDSGNNVNSNNPNIISETKIIHDHKNKTEEDLTSVAIENEIVDKTEELVCEQNNGQLLYHNEPNSNNLVETRLFECSSAMETNIVERQDSQNFTVEINKISNNCTLASELDNNETDKTEKLVNDQPINQNKLKSVNSVETQLFDNSSARENEKSQNAIDIIITRNTSNLSSVLDNNEVTEKIVSDQNLLSSKISDKTQSINSSPTLEKDESQDFVVVNSIPSILDNNEIDKTEELVSDQLVKQNKPPDDNLVDTPLLDNSSAIKKEKTRDILENSISSILDNNEIDKGEKLVCDQLIKQNKLPGDNSVDTPLLDNSEIEKEKTQGILENSISSILDNNEIDKTEELVSDQLVKQNKPPDDNLVDTPLLNNSSAMKKEKTRDILENSISSILDNNEIDKGEKLVRDQLIKQNKPQDDNSVNTPLLDNSSAMEKEKTRDILENSISSILDNNEIDIGEKLVCDQLVKQNKPQDDNSVDTLLLDNSSAMEKEKTRDILEDSISSILDNNEIDKSEKLVCDQPINQNKPLFGNLVETQLFGISPTVEKYELPDFIVVNNIPSILDNNKIDKTKKLVSDQVVNRNKQSSENSSEIRLFKNSSAVEKEKSQDVVANLSNMLESNEIVDAADKVIKNQYLSQSNLPSKKTEKTQSIDRSNVIKNRVLRSIKVKNLFGEDDNDESYEINKSLKRKMCISSIPTNSKKKKTDDIKEKNETKMICENSISFVEPKRKTRISHFTKNVCDNFINRSENVEITPNQLSDNYNSLNSIDKIEKAKVVLAELNEKLAKKDKPAIFLNRSVQKPKTYENKKEKPTILSKEPRGNKKGKLSTLSKEPQRNKKEKLSILNEERLETDIKNSELVNIKPESEVRPCDIPKHDTLYVDRTIVAYDDIDNSTEASSKKNVLSSIILEYLNEGRKKIDLKISENKSIQLVDTIKNHLSSKITIKTLDDLSESLKKHRDIIIAHAIVLYISEERPNDGNNPVLLPGMPIMSYTHQTSLCLMQKLRKDTTGCFKRNIYNLVMEDIEFKLFKLNDTPYVEVATLLSKFYAILCFSTKQKDKLRVFCMDALYCLSFKAIPVIYSVLQVWPHLFPKNIYKQAQDPLVIVIMHLLITITDRDEYKNENLKGFIVKHYGYKGGEYNDDEILAILSSLIKDIEIHSSKTSLMMALLIFSKRCGPEWCYKRIIINLLLPILDDDNTNHSNRTFAAKLIGPLVRPFPPTMAVQREIITKKLTNILKKQVAPMIDEAIICSLCCFTKQSYDSIIQEVIRWHPSHPISQETREALKQFVRSKHTTYWSKNKKYLK